MKTENEDKALTYTVGQMALNSWCPRKTTYLGIKVGYCPSSLI